MRDTMRDNSVRRKPTRAASNTKARFGLGPSRNDSLSPARVPLSRTPSPDDAASAAQTAQLRLHTPPPAAYVNYSYRREATPTNEPTLSPTNSMRNNLDKTTRERFDPDGIQLRELNDKSRSGSDHSRVPIIQQGSAAAHYHSSKRQHAASKVKAGASRAFNSYASVWKDRKEHVSDEQLGVKAIVDYVQQRKQSKRISSPVPQQNFHNALPYAQQTGSVAWPGGKGIPLERAPTPPQIPNDRYESRPLSPPEPSFARGRDRQASIHTARTGMTTWSKIQNAVTHGNSDPALPSRPPTDFFAGAWKDDVKGKGKASGKLPRNPGLIVKTHDLPYSLTRAKPTIIHGIADPSLDEPATTQQKWNPQDHVFNPERESYLSAAHGNRYRANTAASSIYSQPAANDTPQIADYPPPPAVPGEYAHATARPKTPSRPVSPLTVDKSIDDFFTPKRAANRRVAGDWTDSLCGSGISYKDENDGRVSPLNAGPLKSRPAAMEPRDASAGDHQARGTQFYDFYRDSGFVFSGGKQR